MTRPSVCVIFNNVDESSSIGKLCAWSVRAALDAGWRVSVVARDLDPDLRQEVEWLPLYVPPRLHAVQWYAARSTVRRAIGDRRWDVVHVQQPQLAPLANILHLHYLVRAARESMPGSSASGWRARSGRAQARLTELGESRCLARLPSALRLVPVSSYLQEQFVRLYGRHEPTTVLDNPCPDVMPSSPARKAKARERFGIGKERFVVGFLGGVDPRKGGRQLLDALASLDADSLRNLTLLHAGSGVPDHVPDRLCSHVTSIGYLSDTTDFFSACDVFVAASSFDPGPLTAWESVAHHVPVIGTPGCGVVQDLSAVGGAVVWNGGSDLSVQLDQVRRERTRLMERALTLSEDRTRQMWERRLIGIYRISAKRVVTEQSLQGSNDDDRSLDVREGATAADVRIRPGSSRSLHSGKATGA